MDRIRPARAPRRRWRAGARSDTAVRCESQPSLHSPSDAGRGAARLGSEDWLFHNAALQRTDYPKLNRLPTRAAQYDRRVSKRFQKSRSHSLRGRRLTSEQDLRRDLNVPWEILLLDG